MSTSLKAVDKLPSSPGAGPSNDFVQDIPVSDRKDDEGKDITEEEDDEDDNSGDEQDGLTEGMDPSGFSGPESSLKPLTPEALAAFKAAQERTGVIYISRIPPGMQPVKVRHLMSAYGEVGRVYLQQEGEKALGFFVFRIMVIDCIARGKTSVSTTQVYIDKKGALH